MFSFFSHTKEGSRNIILDIQSGLVRGALIMDDENGISHILSVITKLIPIKTHIVNSTHLTKKVLKLVSEVIEHLSNDSAGHNISNIHYILSSPWISSQLKTIKIDYKKETEITSSILDDIVKSELKQKMDMEQDTQIIEQKIFEIKLNGYASTSFENKKAHILEISLATSFASKTFLNKLHSVVQGKIHINNATHNSALLMQYTAFREILNDKHEYVFIHIHSELTDIVVVKNNLCKHIASFPFGISTFSRKIALATKQSIESSDSIISLFQGDKLNENEKINIQKIIDPLLHEWSNLCIKSIKTTFDTTSIPRTVYLLAHSHFNLFKEALLFQNDLNFSIISCENISDNKKIVFEKSSVQSNTMKMYTLAMKTVL